MAAPKFLFLKWELILCNIFSPFCCCFCFWCYRLIGPCCVGRGQQMHLSCFFSSTNLQQCPPYSVILFLHPCCGAAEQKDFSRVGENKEDHPVVILTEREKATAGLLVHVWALSVSLLLRGSKTSSWCMIINNESHLKTLRGKLLDHVITLYYWCCINGEKDLF